MSQPIRLQKYFTDCGVLSRRKAEEEIQAGRVLVNGSPASVGDRVTPGADEVTYLGRQVLPREEDSFLYLMLNKPRGIVTSAKDEKGRATVTDLVKSVGTRVYPVGRLDMDSDGLLLLTNDGEFANHLTHPKHEIPKIYEVTLSIPPTQEQLDALSSPMELDGYALQPVKVEQLCGRKLRMTLFEGRNRQIRRMCQAVGLHVTELHRSAIGKLTLGDLKKGAWRRLTADEVDYLFPQKTSKE